jgi:hypothetical protein
VRAALAGALWAVALPALAEPRLAVGGHVDSTSPLLVVLELHNTGPEAAVGVEVEGELRGEIDRAKRRDPIPPGARVPLALSFPRTQAAPGVHALGLTVTYADAGGRLRMQPAWLLLTLGATESATPRIAVEVPPVSIGTVTDVPVRLTSTDDAPRRVLVRLLPARGLQAPGPPVAVEVAAHSSAVAHVRLLRSGAMRPSTVGVVVLAEWDAGGRAGANAAAGTIQVEPDPALVPRLRPYLVAAGVLLLTLAAWWELRRRQPADERSTTSPPDTEA